MDSRKESIEETLLLSNNQECGKWHASHQGKLQGMLASAASLATVIGPLAISTIYFMSRGSFPGLVWLIGAGLYVLCLPVLMRGPLTSRTLPKFND